MLCSLMGAYLQCTFTQQCKQECENLILTLELPLSQYNLYLGTNAYKRLRRLLIAHMPHALSALEPNLICMNL